VNEIETKLLLILAEDKKHLTRLIWAYKKIVLFMPLNVNSYTNLTENEISYLDQFLYRFSKLQDSMGEKLFITVLILLDENIKNKAFIDILNRLEQLGLLIANDWRELRKIRNSIAHEYSLNQLELINNLNNIFTKTVILYQIYKNIYEFSKNKFLFIKQNENEFNINITELNL
jgi:hypothetical protein